MEFLSKVQLSCFLLSYLCAFGVEVYQVVRSRTGLTRGLLFLFVAAGVVAHTAYLVTRSSQSGLPPLVGSSHDWLLVLAWLGAFLYALLTAARQESAVGLFLLPLLLGLVVMAVFVEDSGQDATQGIAAYRWGMLHAATLLIGMGAIAAATICALMYMLQYQKLRGKDTWLHRLSLASLEQLTAVNRWLVIVTVAMLTVGLVTGFILAAIQPGEAGSTFNWADPIVLDTTVMWALMVAALCWLLTRREQTGRQIAKLTLMAGGFLLLTIFGLMLLSGGVHGKSNPPTETAYMKGAAISAEQS